MLNVKQFDKSISLFDYMICEQMINTCNKFHKSIKINDRKYDNT